MQALSYVSLVPLEDKEGFIKEVQDDASLRAEGYSDFNIKPEGDRKEYYVVTYIEPFEGNEAAFGFDLFSNPARKAALEEAGDANLPVATAPIRLVQEKGEQSGFLIFLPVYKNGMPIGTVEERQEALMGFISAVFRAEDLFTSFLNTFPEFSNVHLEVVDLLAQKTGEENFLIFNKHDEAYSDYKFTAQKSMSVGGREWILSFYELPGFVKSVGTERYIPVAVIFAGVLLSILLFLILYLFSSTRQKAILIARDITKENEEVRKKLEERALELKNANSLMTGRESRIIELKEENERLRKEQTKKNKSQNDDSNFYDSNI
jgi:CHASE1-domain containing sensor protein